MKKVKPVVSVCMRQRIGFSDWQ